MFKRGRGACVVLFACKDYSLPLEPQCQYSDTQVIIDCTEMRCQTPPSLLLQSEMLSQYKSHTTLKGMIGVSPNGAVTFLSWLCQ